MCVILIADTKRPTDDLLEKAERQNPDGAGIAWREDGHIRWKKSIELEEISELCETLPLPYVVHFRIVSSGTKRPALCHPFPIHPEVSLQLEGKTTGYVLFHNGTWHSWKHSLLEAVVRLPATLPVGKWSDSRAMAWHAAHFGVGFLELTDEKCLAFGPKDLEVFGTGWSLDAGVWASNRYFEHTPQQGFFGVGDQRTMCRDRTCTVKVGLDSYGYCQLHTFKHKGEHSEALVLVNGRSSEAVEGSGGALELSSETPFVHALQLFKDGKISKKQFKKLKRGIDLKLRDELPILKH